MKIFLFEFQRDGNVWRKTNAPSDVVYLTNTFEAATIGSGNLEQTTEQSKSNLEVKLDIYDAFSQEFLGGFNDSIMTLTLFVQSDEGTVVGWKGRLSEILPKDPNLVLRFESIFTSLKRPGLRARYQKTCRHLLYGRGCNLDPETFAVSGLLVDLNKTVLQIAEAALQPNGYYLGGMVKMPNNELAYIISHSGEFLTIQRENETLSADFETSGPSTITINIYPGCDRLRQTCNTKFANLDNYGGFPWIPTRNPMDGSKIN